MRRLTLYVRVVLDTNILISALITKGTPPDNRYQAWLNGEIEVVMTAAQIAEIRDVLVRPQLKRFIHTDEAVAIVENFDAYVLGVTSLWSAAPGKLPLSRILMHTFLSLLTLRVGGFCLRSFVWSG